jgi:hypothetical protein
VDLDAVRAVKEPVALGPRRLDVQDEAQDEIQGGGRRRRSWSILVPMADALTAEELALSLSVEWADIDMEGSPGLVLRLIDGMRLEDIARM